MWITLPRTPRIITNNQPDQDLQHPLYDLSIHNQKISQITLTVHNFSCEIMLRIFRILIVAQFVIISKLSYVNHTPKNS